MDIKTLNKIDFIETDNFFFQVSYFNQKTSLVEYIDIETLKSLFENKETSSNFKILSHKLCLFWWKILNRFQNAAPNSEQVTLLKKHLADIVGLLKMKNFYSLEENIVELVRSCYYIGKSFYLKSDFSTSLIFFHQAILFFKSIKTTNKQISVKFKIWPCFDYLSSCQRKLGLYGDALNSVLEGVFREKSCLKSAVSRWFLIMSEFLTNKNNSKLNQPKYVTLSSALKKYLGVQVDLTLQEVLLAEWISSQQQDVKCDVYEKTLLEEWLQVEEDPITRIRLKLWKCRGMIININKEEDSYVALSVCKEALKELEKLSGEREVRSLALKGELLVIKALLNLPNSNEDLNISGQLKAIEKLKSSEPEIDEDSGVMEQSKEDGSSYQEVEAVLLSEALLSNDTVLRLEEACEVFEKFFVKFQVDSEISSEEADDLLEGMEILISLLLIHQHVMTSSLLRMTLQLSIWLKKSSSFLWSSMMFSDLLLEAFQYEEALLFMEQMQQFQAALVDVSSLSPQTSSVYIQCIITQTKVYFLNDQLEKAAEKLGEVEKLLGSLNGTSLTKTIVRARVLLLLGSLCSSKRDLIIPRLTSSPLFNNQSCCGFNCLKNNTTELEWKLKATRLLSGLLFYFYDKSKSPVMERPSDKWTMLHLLLNTYLETGRGYLRTGLSRECKSFLMQVLVYARSFHLKYKYCQVFLELFQLSEGQGFTCESRGYLRLLEKVIRGEKVAKEINRNRKVGNNLEELEYNRGKKGTKREDEEKNDHQISLKSRDILKNNSFNNLNYDTFGSFKQKSMLGDRVVLRTPKTRSSTRETKTTVKKKQKSLKIFEDEIGTIEEEKIRNEEKENKKILKETKSSKIKPASVNISEFTLSQKYLSLNLDDELSSPSLQMRRQKDGGALNPPNWCDRKFLEEEVDEVMRVKIFELKRVLGECQMEMRLNKNYMRVVQTLDLLLDNEVKLEKSLKNQLREEFDWVVPSFSILQGKCKSQTSKLTSHPVLSPLLVEIILLRIEVALFKKEKKVFSRLFSLLLSKFSHVLNSSSLKSKKAKIELYKSILSSPRFNDNYFSDVQLMKLCSGRFLWNDEMCEKSNLIRSPSPKTSSSSYISPSSPFILNAPLKAPRRPHISSLELPRSCAPPSPSPASFSPLQCNLDNHFSGLNISNDSSDSFLDSGLLLQQLTDCFFELQSDPPLLEYRSLCHSLAGLLQLRGPQAAHLLIESQGISFRHSSYLNVIKKIRNLEEAENKEIAMESLIILREWVHFSWEEERFKKSINLLPQDWTVCQVSLMTDEHSDLSRLVVIRIRKDQHPTILPLPPSSLSQRQILLKEFDWILKDNTNTMKVTEKKQWWEMRKRLDEKLEDCLESIEKEWFCCWIGSLMGHLLSDDDRKEVEKAGKEVMKKCLFIDPSKEEELKLFLSSGCKFDKRQVLQALKYLSKFKDSDIKEEASLHEALVKEVPFLQALILRLNMARAKRGPVILILDKAIQHLPIENLPSLENQSITRHFSYHHLIGHLNVSLNDQNSLINVGVQKNNVFYVLNPDDNLPNTQQLFENWFQKKEPLWEGTVGRPPSSDQLIHWLKQKDLFIYSGHGTGGKYLNGTTLQAINCRSAALLMGCSSGRLCSYGQFEPSGMLLHYVLAGSSCIVANLWEVTDRDIDRYTESLLQNWISAAEESSMESDQDSNSNNHNFNFSSSSFSPLSPTFFSEGKPFVNKLSLKYKKLNRTTNDTECLFLQRQVKSKMFLNYHSNKGRTACKLRFLIGAAPVVYGFPMFISNQ